MSEQEKDYKKEDDSPIKGVDLPVWVEEIIISAAKILMRRYLNIS